MSQPTRRAPEPLTPTKRGNYTRRSLSWSEVKDRIRLLGFMRGMEYADIISYLKEIVRAKKLEVNLAPLYDHRQRVRNARDVDVVAIFRLILVPPRALRSLNTLAHWENRRTGEIGDYEEDE